MSNTEAKLAPESAKHTKGATARKLIQAAALAAMLVPLGSVAVEAASITCRFNNTDSGFFGGEGCGGGDSSPTPTTSRFDFGDYYLELTFTLDPGADFGVSVVTTGMTQDEFQVKAGAFSSYTCIELTADGGCVDFAVIPDEPRVDLATGQVNWTHYEIEINWQKFLPDPYDEARMRMLHDSGPGITDGIYDEDMCITAQTNTSYNACLVVGDPLIRSGNTDFHSFTAALSPATPVPEPSSLILLATGIGGALYRRRRRYRV